MYQFESSWETQAIYVHRHYKLKGKYPCLESVCFLLSDYLQFCEKYMNVQTCQSPYNAGLFFNQKQCEVEPLLNYSYGPMVFTDPNLDSDEQLRLNIK